MITKQDFYYIRVFLIGIIIVLLAHYLIILRFNFHPTLQVFMSLILFWIWLAIVAMTSKKK